MGFSFRREVGDFFDEIIVKVNVESVFCVTIFFSKHFKEQGLNQADLDFFVNLFPFVIQIYPEKITEELDIAVEITQLFIVLKNRPIVKWLVREKAPEGFLDKVHFYCLLP